MKFQVIISRSIVKAMFDSEAEINILLYLMTLKLELMIWSNMTIIIRNVNNKSSYIIEYISEVSIQIKNMIIW